MISHSRDEMRGGVILLRTLLKKYLFFTVKGTGSLGASTFHCKLTETVKWKRYCIFTDWYQFICKNLKTLMAYLVC